MGTNRTQAPQIGGTFVALVRSLSKDLFGTYRPERHYMRGPGPAWHAKHDRPNRAAPAPLGHLVEATR